MLAAEKKTHPENHHRTPPATHLRWQIGNKSVTRLVERVSRYPITDFIPGATRDRTDPHANWLAAYGMTEPGLDVSPVSGYLIGTNGRRILVDTCVGL
jgi:hypothetical protein